MTNVTRSIKEWSGAVGVGALFLVSAYVSGHYASSIEAWIGHAGALGMLAYVAAAFGATVIAPVSALPLIPLAVALWGPIACALLSLLGWTTGASAAFILAQRYGYRWVRRFASIQKLQKYASLVPERKLFLSVLLLRMVLPMDILSYAVGLFTRMRFMPYFTATLLGATPFAFMFAYTATLPVQLQVLALGIVGVFLYFIQRSLRETLPVRNNERSDV